MNVIDRAESLCGDTYRYEENAEDADGTLRNLVDRANILPDLVAECKRQQEEIETLEKMATGLSNDLDDFGEQNEALRERVEKAERDCVSLEASSRAITDVIGCEWSQDAAIRAVSELKTEAARWQALRPEVQIFAEAMERKLRANDYKGGWCGTPVRWLRNRVSEECNELDIAIAAYMDELGKYMDGAGNEGDLSTTRRVILCECADIANFAMMIAANCKGLEAAAALGKPRAWPMSEERIKALDEALNAMEWTDEHDSGFGLEDERAVLQTMLAEAEAGQ